jgi:hypothetical protein
MKKYLLLIVSVLLFAACSTPKYAYYFDHYDYNSGKKKAEDPKAILAQTMLSTPEMSPLQINRDAVVASAERRIKNVEKVPVAINDKEAFEKKYSAMSRTEKKEFRKELKSEIKKYIKAKKAGDNIASIEETKAMDHDLKMALIFGAVGIGLSLFGTVNSIFWILGVISTVIAIVFLIIWLAKQ